MKTIQDDLKLGGNPPLDMTLFWQVAAQLPARKNERRSTHAIPRCRYQANGHRARTFYQMAHELGVTRTRAAELVRRALQRVRAYKAKFVVRDIDQELTAISLEYAELSRPISDAILAGTPAAASDPDATHAQQWRRACDALGLGYASHPEILVQAVRHDH